MRKNLVICKMIFLTMFALGMEQSTNKIKLKFENKEIVVVLNNNGASNDLLDQLPLELKFENYGGIEKISYLTKRLNINNSPGSCTPKIYDLTYYSPWGNLAFFTKDFRTSNGLVPLGKIESGFENLESIDKALKVVIEKIE